MALDIYTHFTGLEIREICGRILSLISLAHDITDESEKKHYEEQYPKFIKLLKELDEMRAKDKIHWIYHFFTDLCFLTLGSKLDKK